MKNRKKREETNHFPDHFQRMEPENEAGNQQMEPFLSKRPPPPPFFLKGTWTYSLQFFVFALGAPPFFQKPKTKGGDLRFGRKKRGVFIFSG